MKKLLLLLIIPFLSFGQQRVIPDEKSQLKISSSIEYKKIPLKMKMFKKQLPKESVSYYSKVGERLEINMDFKMFGKHVVNSTIAVENYTKSMIWTKILTMVNDSIVENVFEEKMIEDKPTNEILVGKDQKEILGYNCVYFLLENDSSKMEGFLCPNIRGTGEFKNYGLPLEYKVSSKTEKTIIITKTQNILIELLDENKFILTED